MEVNVFANHIHKTLFKSSVNAREREREMSKPNKFGMRRVYVLLRIKYSLLLKWKLDQQFQAEFLFYFVSYLDNWSSFESTVQNRPSIVIESKIFRFFFSSKLLFLLLRNISFMKKYFIILKVFCYSFVGLCLPFTLNESGKDMPFKLRYNGIVFLMCFWTMITIRLTLWIVCKEQEQKSKLQANKKNKRNEC